MVVGGVGGGGGETEALRRHLTPVDHAWVELLRGGGYAEVRRRRAAASPVRSRSPHRSLVAVHSPRLGKGRLEVLCF